VRKLIGGLFVRKLILAGAWLLMISRLAQAAGMPLKAPPPPPVFSWTGFYIGASGGYAWADSNVITAVASSGRYFITTDPGQIGSSGASSIRPKGGIGGIQSGYNWQTGNVVFGVEVDFNAFSLSDERSITTVYLSDLKTFTVNQSVKTDWLFTARPRLGWATNNWLWYVTGGLAMTRLKYDNSFTDTAYAAFETGSVSKTNIGWSVGGGAEFALANHWSAKAEYLYVDFGGLSSTGTVSNDGGFTPASLSHSADLTAHIVRAGVNYRF
jgi:outer membrane immunogenic protein